MSIGAASRRDRREAGRVVLDGVGLVLPAQRKHSMKGSITMLAASALVALVVAMFATAADAQANRTLPKQFHGIWCRKDVISETEVHHRCPYRDPSDFSWTIKADRMESGTPKVRCKLLDVSPLPMPGSYLAKFSCIGGERSNPITFFRMEIVDDTLRMNLIY